MYVNALPTCVPVHHTYVQGPQIPEESVKSPETGVTGCCEATIGVLGLEPRSLEEQPVLITTEH